MQNQVTYRIVGEGLGTIDSRRKLYLKIEIIPAAGTCSGIDRLECEIPRGVEGDAKVEFLERAITEQLLPILGDEDYQLVGLGREVAA